MTHETQALSCYRKVEKSLSRSSSSNSPELTFRALLKDGISRKVEASKI